MTLIQSLTCLSGVYLVGVLISKKTIGKVPSALAALIIMMPLFWTGIITLDDIEASGFGAIYAIMTATIIVNVGTTFDIKMLKKEWKLVVVCLASLAGCALLLFTVGNIILDRDMMIGSYPVLAGGAIAVMLMQDAAMAKGLTEVAACILLVFAVQGWFGMPIISNMVRIESNNLLAARRQNKAPEAGNVQEKATVEIKPDKTKLIDRIPKKYDSPYLNFFICALMGLIAAQIANITSPRTMGIFGVALVSVIVGVICRTIGISPKDPLTKATVMPLYMMVLIMYMTRSLANLTPAALIANLVPVFGCVIIGGIGLALGGLAVRKLSGLSIPMSIAMAFQAFSGYPVNYQVATEVIDTLTDDPEEVEYLKEQIVTKIVIGSIVSVSVCSVIIGAIFVNLL